MALQKKKTDPKSQAAAEPAKGGRKKLIFIILGALLLVGGSVGVTVMLLTGDKSDGSEVVDAGPEKGDPVYIELKPFTVNLDPSDPVGFLQIQIQVLTYFAEVAEALETHKPLIRNNLMLLFGLQKSADLRSAQGKSELQKKVKESIQQVIDKYGNGGEVDNIFFTNFVMQ